MKTAFSTAIVLLLVWGAHASEPFGRYLILDNEQLIEGEVRREGDRYLVKRGGGEASIPANRVSEIAADRQAVHRIMRGRCNLRDVDDRLRLIRWLTSNNLRSEALAEAEELCRFRPDEPQARSLLQGLRSMAMTPVSVAKSTAPKLLDKVVEVEPMKYNPEAYPLFVSKVQPILMNLCFRCHSDGQGGGFQLTRANDGGDRKAAAHNLGAALKHLDRNNPDSSPLLEKAITAHGGLVRPALRDRQAPAFPFLETWARQAVVREEAPAVAATPVVATKNVLESNPMPTPPRSIFGETSTSQAKPEPQTEPKDPFDPAIFNGDIQPKR